LDEQQLEDSQGPERRARGLGWFSVALGVAQLASPGAIARLSVGDDGQRRRWTMRAVGARELACGLALLGRRRPTGWVWMRLAGDLVDLAMLGSSLTARKADKARVLRSMAGVLGVTALDAITGVQLTRQDRAGIGGSRAWRFTRSITVNRPPEEVYRFWRSFQNLPRFMTHLEAVEVRDERRSHWVARGPAGLKVEWDAEILEERPNELISWRSLPGAGVANAGTVHFRRAPAGRGTELELELAYAPPGGLFGVSLAKLLGEDPSQQVQGDLRRFKQVMEIGEVVHSDASIHRGRHPARPPEVDELPRNGGRR
jgi:uncharacterized membrane protein